ncbi:hypothetical protein TNCT_264671 [Trichonephila clavata]|uniref:Uncharacterized protein n=1 Tax=Trichonephila clavata TaxID=2740835 RepID=A0A8X6KCM4_TRICU|nr:hypothetical protein TNCT_264671 [Trichonephila clavata]
MTVFYNMLDTSAYNAFVLWASIYSDWNENKLTKQRLCLKELGKSFIFPYIEVRANVPRSEDSIKNSETNTEKSESEPLESSENTSLCVKRAQALSIYQ